MSADAPRFGWKEALMLACSIVGPIAVVGGAVKDGGKTEALAEDTLRRVVQLEADGRADRERREADRVVAAQTAERVARIEALAQVGRGGGR
ncbi:hypothetical protein [Sphingomonas sp. VNH70]|uniref:hypothetical protein n=1 Tax=Sphingomonas silueang TaxID=3156617 RepID=UPI0032B3B1FB